MVVKVDDTSLALPAMMRAALLWLQLPAESRHCGIAVGAGGRNERAARVAINTRSAPHAAADAVGVISFAFDELVVQALERFSRPQPLHYVRWDRLARGRRPLHDAWVRNDESNVRQCRAHGACIDYAYAVGPKPCWFIVCKARHDSCNDNEASDDGANKSHAAEDLVEHSIHRFRQRGQRRHRRIATFDVHQPITLARALLGVTRALHRS
mmetsp:Transcript_48150/g.125874  ORF Transcript_48150/g.125874 Transcript_48150/m.125874 type:complete len:211 (-) Transcript_48150:2-634(-)